MDYIVDYKDRMMNYYPPVLQAISEYKAIIDSESIELSDVHDEMNVVLNNAFLLTMDETRIKQWETMLNITPSSTDLEQRRDVIIARIRGQGKLNTDLINTIVYTFTGGKAQSWVENSTLHVKITPPPANSKLYNFSDIERELQNKVPAHLGLSVTRSYYSWDEVYKNNATWDTVKTKFETWDDVLLYVAS